MNKYSLYKDIGIEWMGEIPKHWVITKNRYGFRKYKNGKNESNETKVLSLTTKGVKIKRNLNFGKSTESYIGHQLVEVGDVVFTPRDFDQTPILSDVSKYDGCISNLYIVDKTKQGVLNHFVNYYWYGLKYSVDYFKIFSHGMRYSFNRFQFDEIPLLIPPLSEQKEIVSFLDDKTQKIDSLIQQKKEKIELLKEKKTSLINLVVTKGLDSNVEMKDSGVEWIDKIPSHWESSKLGFYTTKIGSGSTPRGGSEVYVDSGIPFIRSQNVHFNGLRLDGVSYIKYEVHHSMKGSTVVKEDVLLNITGGSIGRCCIVNVDGEMNVNQHVSIIRTTSKLKNHFLNYILSCDLGQSQVRFNMSGGNREGLTIEGIRDFQITLPPILEQEQIVEYLDKQTEEIDTLIQLEQKKIDTLKEYRQSLISEVVTGKIKVCEEDNSLILNSQTV